MKHVVFYSGGIGSYIAAKRVVDPRDWGKGCRCMTEGDGDD